MTRHLKARRRRSALPRLAALCAALAAGVLAAPAAEAAEGDVKVMTRNLYLGADLTPALTAPNATELALRAQIILDTVKQTNFPRRAKLLAAEIKEHKPDLIGLQEVALWRRDVDPNPSSPTGHPLADGSLTPATDVIYDFLTLLHQELKRQGADYRVVRVQREGDIELPAANACPDVSPDDHVCDGRLTIRDVILKRRSAGVRTRFEDGDNFSDEHSLAFENVAGSGINVVVHRGWLYTEANVRGAKFRFLNTHLEAFDPHVREAQAQDLVAAYPPAAGPATEQSAGRPVVAVGDFNTDDDTVSGDDTLAYAALTSGPNALVERSATGGTEESCCFQTETIDEAPPAALADLDHQVDHVFVSDPDVTEARSTVVGDEPAAFARFGLWPSDHAGIVTKLRFP